MHRSSESIGTLASALAKAQAEISNPEKSMTATIRSPFPREEDRTFRYAPLSTGLDIVRKTLGKHEIATIQTTEIDPSGLIRLTTILAHASGEWMSSDWPVCPVGETAAPHRLGAALTYARRYALFTLVGIAGDDDLDAPYPCAPTEKEVHRAIENNGSSYYRQAPPNQPRSALSKSGSAHPQRAEGLLPPDESATLRERLMAEVSQLQTTEQAAEWAHRSLPMKNRLTKADARSVEETFGTQVSRMDCSLADGTNRTDASVGSAPHTPQGQVADRGVQNLHPPHGQTATRARRSVAPKSIRLRDKEHRRFVSRQACLVCGRAPSDPHHLRFAQPRALGRKVSDEFTIPVCRLHHREIHRHGDETKWWAQLGIDPLAIALALWAQTRPTSSSVTQTNADDRASTREIPSQPALPHHP